MLLASNSMVKVSTVFQTYEYVVHPGGGLATRERAVGIQQARTGSAVLSLEPRAKGCQ